MSVSRTRASARMTSKGSSADFSTPEFSSASFKRWEASSK